MKIIITGTTGMVGEGVLLEALQNNKVTEVLSISRKSIYLEHPKLKQLIVSDFTQLEKYKSEIEGFEACFFCAGISSVGKKEDEFAKITYDTTLAFAKTLFQYNPTMMFCYVSGSGTDSTEKGKKMWARVKGKTENDLMKVGFRKVYNFRPAAMIPFPKQQYANKLFYVIAKTLHFFNPKSVLTLSEVGKAMINGVDIDFGKNILEIKDIRELAQSSTKL